jgi:predicted component of type VI protein secretion system
MEITTQRFLVVIEGPNEGQSYPLQDMVCTIGRTADNTIVIDSTRISRHHTQIRFTERTAGTAAIVEDMGSTNGTWVNHRQLTGPHQLMPGDVITLADYITFRYEVEDALSTERLAPAMPGNATQMLDDSSPYPPPPPPPPDYEEPYRAYSESPTMPPQEPFIQFDSAPQTVLPSQPTPPPQRARTAPPATPPVKRSKWIYLVVAILLILICICLGVAIYLWFAPVTFWESVFELFNIPLP